MVNKPTKYGTITLHLPPTCCKMKCDLFTKYVLDPYHTDDIGNSLQSSVSNLSL